MKMYKLMQRDRIDYCTNNHRRGEYFTKLLIEQLNREIIDPNILIAENSILCQLLIKISASWRYQSMPFHQCVVVRVVAIDHKESVSRIFA